MGGGADAPPPRPVLPPATEVDPKNVGRTGYGEITGERRSMYSGDVKHSDTFPEDITPLELKNWYNHSLRDDYPAILPNAKENRRIWQDMEVERMLDVHPTHELHPNELPNYHFWPSIQNELHPKIKDSESDFVSRFQHDQTALPRFHRPGTPKTPTQEQDFYIPLKPDGRFDYKLANKKLGYSASVFDVSGWNRRFLLPLNQPSMPGFVDGSRTFAQNPTYFRVNELSFYTRVSRAYYGSTFDRYIFFSIFYLGALVFASHKAGHYKALNWENEGWNYDMEFSKYNRDKGGFHGAI